MAYAQLSGMNPKTLSLMSLFLVAPACGTAVDADTRVPASTGAEVSVAPERSSPPVYYDSNTSIDPVVAHRLNMQMTTQNAVQRERRALIEPTLSDACGWERPTVYFSTGEAEVGLVSQATIDSISVCLRSEAIGDEPIVLVGYADQRGASYDNLELGLQRANEVKQELVETGVAPGRIQTYSRGEYLVDADDQHQDDRRVVVKLDR